MNSNNHISDKHNKKLAKSNKIYHKKPKLQIPKKNKINIDMQNYNQKKKLISPLEIANMQNNCVKTKEELKQKSKQINTKQNSNLNIPENCPHTPPKNSNKPKRLNFTFEKKKTEPRILSTKSGIIFQKNNTNSSLFHKKKNISLDMEQMQLQNRENSLFSQKNYPKQDFNTNLKNNNNQLTNVNFGSILEINDEQKQDLTQPSQLQKNKNNSLLPKININISTKKIKNFLNNNKNITKETFFDYYNQIDSTSITELSKEEKNLYGDRIMKGYIKKKLLGKGGYGAVWLCIPKNNNQNNNFECAVKQTPKKNNPDLFVAKNEINILKILNSENCNELIPKIYGVDEDNNDIWFAFEKGGISLSSLTFKIKGEFEKGERIYNIQKGIFLMELFNDIEQFKFYVKKLIEGIDYINSKKIIHSDIKADNILIEYIYKENPHIFKIKSIKIIDYGSAIFLNSTDAKNNFCTSTTPEYLCPELTINNKNFLNDLFNNNYKYINSIDIWSLGITLLELCICCPMWMSYKSKITLFGKNVYTYGLFGCKCRDNNKIYQKQLDMSKNLEKYLKNSLINLFKDKNHRNNFIDLLSKMLNIDYKKRITASEALKHPFIDVVDKNSDSNDTNENI